eukprot:XP_001706954.1 Hypothetical protein GL50803_114849 [Giardia lamblia ATCC 50803]
MYTRISANCSDISTVFCWVVIVAVGGKARMGIDSLCCINGLCVMEAISLCMLKPA